MNANTHPPSVRLRWSRQAWHRPINLALYLGGCLLVGTGWVLAERLPRGRPGRGLTLLGWERHDWGAFHLWLGYAVAALVALHLLLHAGWLRQVAARGKGWLLWSGLGLGAAILSFFLLLPIRRG